MERMNEKKASTTGSSVPIVDDADGEAKFVLGFIGKGFNDLSLQNFVLMVTTLEISVHKRCSVMNTACGVIILTCDSSPFLDIYCYFRFFIPCIL
jgi:hypothetical protein